MRDYLSLQKIRLFRYCHEFGVAPILAILLLVLVFFGFTYILFLKIAHPIWSYLVLQCYFLLRLSDLKRNQFLLSVFRKKQHQKLRFGENLLLALVFNIGLISVSQFTWHMILPWMISFAFAFYHRASSFQFAIPTPFGKYPFEFIQGFRKYLPLLVAIFVLAFIGLFVDNINLSIASLGFCLLVCIQFYLPLERKFFLWIHQHTPKEFLWSKIKVSLRYTLWIACPFIILIAIMDFTMLAWVMLIMLLGWLYILLTLFMKYAFYPNRLDLPLAFVLLFNMILPPLLLISLPYYYMRASQNLNTFLYDTP